MSPTGRVCRVAGQEVRKALGKWDPFKSSFGSYDTGKVADWRTQAEAALAELTTAATICPDPPKTDVDKVVVAQTQALQTAKDKEEDNRSAACSSYA